MELSGIFQQLEAAISDLQRKKEAYEKATSTRAEREQHAKATYDEAVKQAASARVEAMRTATVEASSAQVEHADALKKAQDLRLQLAQLTDGLLEVPTSARVRVS